MAADLLFVVWRSTACWLLMIWLFQYIHKSEYFTLPVYDVLAVDTTARPYLWFYRFECRDACALSSLSAGVKNPPPLACWLLADLSMLLLQEEKTCNDLHATASLQRHHHWILLAVRNESNDTVLSKQLSATLTVKKHHYHWFVNKLTPIHTTHSSFWHNIVTRYHISVKAREFVLYQDVGEEASLTDATLNQILGIRSVTICNSNRKPYR